MAIPTKKIPELDLYGSVNNPARLKDLYEVSKNIGTYGTPDYPANSSRKITHEELVDGIGGIPYSGQNYEVVKATGNAVQNGTNLLAAAVACYAKTPNGVALSNTNRAVVYFLAGTYDIGASEINVGQFVDFKALAPTKSVKVSATNATATFKIADINNYSLEGFTIENTSTGKSIGHNISATDNGVWDKLFFTQGNDTENTIYNGKYTNCDFTNVSALRGNISGTVENCKFGNTSCGYSGSSAIEISGTIKKCTSNGNSFGSSLVGGVIISGLIEDCKSDYNSFGYSQAMGYDIVISGKIKNCEAITSFSFGATIETSVFVYISGTIENCKAGGFSFGYSSVLSKVEVSGLIKNCTADARSFGSTTVTGVIDGCNGVNSFGLHRGLIINSKFIFPLAGVNDVIRLANGAKISYSTIIQLEPSLDSIKIESGANVSISHCETNKDFNIVSGSPYTNLISTAYNVIDSDLR